MNGGLCVCKRKSLKKPNQMPQIEEEKQFKDQTMKDNMTNNDLHNTTQKTKENYRSGNMNHRYFVLLYTKNNHRHLLISLYDWNHSQCNFGIDIFFY